MSFSRATLTELIARIGDDIDGRLSGAASRLRRSVLNVLGRVHAGAADDLYGYADFLSLQLMPDTAESDYLDRWSSIWGVARKAAAPATGIVTLTGLNGAILPIGAQLARIDGTIYATTQAIVFEGVTATVPIAALVAGADGSTPAGAKLTFTSPASGVGAIATASDGLVGGADEETDAALLGRLLARIQTPPNGGAAADWVAWALQLPGVTRAWSYPGWTGPGTVGVTFVYDGRDDILPTPAEIDAMVASLEPLRPVTATPVVFAPQPYVVPVLLSATPDSPAVHTAIVAELTDLFFREGEPGGTIYISRINEAISQAADEFDHVVYAPGGNVAAPAGYIPMLGAVTYQ